MNYMYMYKVIKKMMDDSTAMEIIKIHANIHEGIIKIGNINGYGYTITKDDIQINNFDNFVLIARKNPFLKVYFRRY